MRQSYQSFDFSSLVKQDPKERVEIQSERNDPPLRRPADTDREIIELNRHGPSGAFQLITISCLSYLVIFVPSLFRCAGYLLKTLSSVFLLQTLTSQHDQPYDGEA